MDTCRVEIPRRVVCILLSRMPAEGFDIQVFAEACHRFTPKIAIRAQEGVFLDITGCQRLCLESNLSLRVQSLARRFSLEVQIGFAEDAPTALAMARYRHFIGYNLNKYHLPLEALLDYANPFAPFLRDADLTKKVLKIIETNKKLGLKNVGDFLSLPVFSLASRFGREGVEIRARIGGKLEAPWPAFQIPERLIEKEDVEETVGLEPLLFVLKKLVDRAMARLRGLGKRASVVQIEFKLEPWSILKKTNRTWQISFPLSQGSSMGVMPIFQERLNFDLARDPLQAPVQKIEFHILETVPGRSAQRDFFDQKEEDLEKWGALISRLACKLGKDNVFHAIPVDRYLPEKSWTKAIETASATASARIETQDRPARILKNPEFLRLVGNYVVQSNGKRWRTTYWNGPERLSGEWWKDAAMRGFERDYYQVSTEKGEELWIYLDRQDNPPSFYLHGYFD
ncbi:MAG: hypothetical protein ABIQ95_01160 [Bdellovibrionia bacterium]